MSISLTDVPLARYGAIMWQAARRRKRTQKKRPAFRPDAVVEGSNLIGGYSVTSAITTLVAGSTT